MKYKIVTSSELGTDCWSAKRFTGYCHKCNHVRTCKLPEAIQGRIELAKNNVLKIEEKYHEACERLQRVKFGGSWE